MLRRLQEKIGKLDCVVVERAGIARATVSVILCHGFGAPGTDLVPVADALSATGPALRDARFIFPAAPLEIFPEMDGRAWWPINFQKLQQMYETNQIGDLADSVPPELADCRSLIEQIVNREVNEGVPRSQIVLGGFSQGAMLATDCFWNDAVGLGGLIVWSGALINRNRWQELMKARAHQKIVQTHGFLDPVLPFASAAALRDLFKSSGQDLRFHSFQGYHAIPDLAIRAAGQLIAEVANGS